MAEKYCDKCRCSRTYNNNGKYYSPGCWICQECLDKIIQETELKEQDNE